MNYFDSSALIKRFVEEPGSKTVAALISVEPRLATTKVAYAEVHAGLARKLRDGALTPAAHRKMAQLFDSDWLAYLRVEFGERVLALTRDLVRHHPLRGFDATHLASAIHLKGRLGESIQFVASDERLLAAAGGEGLSLIDVRN